MSKALEPDQPPSLRRHVVSLVVEGQVFLIRPASLRQNFFRGQTLRGEAHMHRGTQEFRLRGLAILAGAGFNAGV